MYMFYHFRRDFVVLRCIMLYNLFKFKKCIFKRVKNKFKFKNKVYLSKYDELY